MLRFLAILFFPVLIIYRLCGGHWCQDETNMLLMSIPFVGAMLAWLRARFHHKTEHKDCEAHQHRSYRYPDVETCMASGDHAKSRDMDRERCDDCGSKE